MRCIIALVLLCSSHTIAAGQESDIDRVPEVPQQAPAEPRGTPGLIYLQTDLTLASLRRDLLVPLPSPSPQWEARGFLDARLNWQSGAFSFAYSGRVNFRVADGLPFPGHQNIQNDLREAYASWQGGRGLFLELGRINLKEGAAVGFNPTDFFKTRTVVEPTSADPTVLREDRLGTVLLTAQKVWAKGSLMVALAPKLAPRTPPYIGADLPDLDPMLDRTNARGRILVKGSIDLFEDISPDLLFYDEAGRSRFGLNLTRGIGDAVVAYLEWAGGSGTNLADDAFQDGLQTGVLPPLPVIPVNTKRRFNNDISIGASYTADVGITFSLEYERHEAGFNGANWRNWFDTGAANRTNTSILGELWFIRGYAADQEEPLAQNALFLRADWPDAVVRNLHLTGFVDGDLRNGSCLAQFTADYFVSSEWTVGGVVDVTFGSRRSDFGSLPQTVTALFKATRYTN